MDRPRFPFSAIVGQHELRLALMAAAVEPSLGGVLVSGGRGTGKSTAVRALRSLLPTLVAVPGCPYHCDPDAPEALDDGCRAKQQGGEALPRAPIATPFVELPLNATEDRVAGTLDVEQALRSGERRFEPGLLAACHRGFLYVDEVNLLDDHLVDLLLDAAASGVQQVEREGISHAHPARFVLLGTMNPEEGSLRPQFLDRFGLSASVVDVADLAEREEIVRRRLAFDEDPARFAAQFAEPEAELAARLVQARAALREVILPEEILSLAVRLASEAKARGHRAEITLLKAGRAIAALLGKSQVDRSCLADAARLALPHRMAAGPLDSPERLETRLHELIDGVVQGLVRRADPPAESDADTALEESLLAMQIPGSTAAGSILFTLQKKHLRATPRRRRADHPARRRPGRARSAGSGRARTTRGAALADWTLRARRAVRAWRAALGSGRRRHLEGRGAPGESSGGAARSATQGAGSIPEAAGGVRGRRLGVDGLAGAASAGEGRGAVLARGRLPAARSGGGGGLRR